MKVLIAEKIVSAKSVRGNSIVLIEGDKIIDVGDEGSISVPAEAEVYDLGNITLIPGLWIVMYTSLKLKDLVLASISVNP
jgi:imidazolonepropionase-like amidohydrolase